MDINLSLDLPATKSLAEIAELVDGHLAECNRSIARYDTNPEHQMTTLRVCLGDCACSGDCIWPLGINLTDWNVYLASQGRELVTQETLDAKIERFRQSKLEWESRFS